VVRGTFGTGMQGREKVRHNGMHRYRYAYPGTGYLVALRSLLLVDLPIKNPGILGRYLPRVPTTTRDQYRYAYLARCPGTGYLREIIEMENLINQY
jgi:hypothetical protein